MSLVILIIVLALVFDYINGFHDAANSIATIVSTKVLSPFQAVLWAAMFNFGAFFLFKDHAVANTISKTVIDTYITLEVILAGLLAAIAWNLLTWWLGIPSSSSHTLIGGFAGAAVAHAFAMKGFMPISEIVASDKIMKTVYFIFLAPIIGMLISAFITLVTIKQNYYGRLLIIGIASLVTFFIFDYFMDVKLEENLKKFHKVSYFEKNASKHPNDSVVQAAFFNATSNFQKSKTHVSEYKSIGVTEVVNRISQEISFSEILKIKQRELVEKYVGYEAIKKVAYFNPDKRHDLESVELLINKCSVYFDSFEFLGSTKTAIKVASILNLSQAKTQKFIKEYQIDPKKSLKSDLEKADNRLLTYIMMVFFAVFALVYFYMEVYRRPTAAKMNQMFKKLQLLSSAAFSLGHGGSDAQKVMGIIGAAMIANGDIIDFKEIPNWVPLACYTAIALGTLSGGWKIVKTMGTKITKVTPLEGVGAETAGAITLFLTAQMGIPVSTTHTITGSIIGVGATKRLSAVRWGVTRSLLFAWIVTIPISALVAALAYFVISLF